MPGFNRTSNSDHGVVRSGSPDPSVTTPPALFDGVWHKAALERCCRGIQPRWKKGQARYHQQQQHQQQTDEATSWTAIRKQRHFNTLSQRHNAAADSTHAFDGNEDYSEWFALRRTTACPVQQVAPTSMRFPQQESSAHDAIARPSSTSHELPQHDKEENENEEEANHGSLQRRQRFYAARPPDSVWSGIRRWGGDQQQQAGDRGAPSFTVGDSISHGDREQWGREGFGSMRSNPGQDDIGVRRLDLLRHILEAVR